MKSDATPPSDLPAGVRLVRHDRIDSTNAEALRLAHDGEAGPLWLTAGEQTGGRGRGGRCWASPPGNLYASLLLRPRCAAELAPQLSLLTAVAVHEAIAAVSAGRIRHPALTLKWPNDILLDGAKAGGILLESVSNHGKPGYAVAIGIGLNLSHHPCDLGRPAAHLGEHLPDIEADALLFAIIHRMAGWLACWQEGAGFARVRDAWIERSLAPGTPISVHAHGGVMRGFFLGIDSGGALRLGSGAPDEPEIRVTAGDIVF
jgi:BirA family biotin operon repressor/biotin-[acetyl-CoA-carboxylase] ligase